MMSVCHLLVKFVSLSVGLSCAKIQHSEHNQSAPPMSKSGRDIVANAVMEETIYLCYGVSDKNNCCLRITFAQGCPSVMCWSCSFQYNG